MIFIISIYLLQVFSTVTETKNEIFGKDLFSIQTEKAENTQKDETHYILRDENGEGSLLTFKEINPYEEWALEYDIGLPNIEFPQKAGITFWYTDQGLEKGEFYGSSDKFTGVMVGLETQGHYLDVLVTVNNGKGEVGQETILRDKINTSKIKQYKGKARIKIINTVKNLKIEVYVNNELIYDALRHYYPSIMKGLDKGKHFSVTTSYYENVPFEKHFELNDVNLYERTEDEDYDPHKINSTIFDPDHNDEIQQTISNVEHFMSFVRFIFGQPEGFTAITGLKNAKKNLYEQRDKLVAMEDRLKNKSANIGDMSSRVSSLEIKIQQVVRGLNDLKYFLKDFEKENTSSSKYMILFIMGCIVTFVVISIGKETKKKKS